MSITQVAIPVAGRSDFSSVSITQCGDEQMWLLPGNTRPHAQGLEKSDARTTPREVWNHGRAPS